MLNRILPQRIDDTYLGHPLAVWLLGAVVLVKSGIALGTIFNGRVAAQSADGIPLDRLGADGAQAVVALFAIWGLAQLAISVFGVLTLTRYRSLVPFMFLLLLSEHLVRKLVLLWKPIARTGTPPGPYINLALVTLMVVGLALSLRNRADLPQP
jgi:hypothetical protein